ncbi:MAG: cadherin-like beta sandwich domain-containing protein [Bacilli bacterium]|nr:cadherin-like beta sandwich domain-containing protein [Bacilli bacterium]
MKKLVIIILSILIIVPFKVYAASPSVSNVSIVSVEEASIGESVKVNMKVTLSGVGTGGEEDYVVVGILYGIVYDDSLLTAINMVQEDWPVAFVADDETGVGLPMNVYTKASAAGCRDGKYCTTASMPINFFINKSTASSASIQVSQIGLIYVKSSDLDRYLQAMENDDDTGVEDYIFTFVQNVSSTKTIRIKQTNNENIQAPPIKMEENKVQAPVSSEIKGSVKTENAPSVNPSGSQNSNTETKSNNKYLSSLQIENYNLSFDKDIHEYDLEIENGVNSLNITATVEDARATYQIIGAEDLVANNNQVTIEVTAENGEKSIYTITTKVKENDDVSLSSKKEKKDKKKKSFEFSIKLEKEHFIIGGVGFVLLLIILLIRKLKDRKIDKALKNL